MKVFSMKRELPTTGNSVAKLTLRGLTVLSMIAASLLAVTPAVSAQGVSAPAASAQSANDIREITLPVPLDSVGPAREGGVYWSNTYGACRGGGCSRSHVGVDLIGPRLTPLLAASDGVISWMRFDTVRGNNLVIEDDEGWKYHYVHINNDSPGTDDGANPFEWAFAPGIERGARVKAGQVVAYMGDSGNAEFNVPQLHFEITRPNGANINPAFSVDAALERGATQKIEVPADALGPYNSVEKLSDDLYQSLRGRPPTFAETQALATAILNDDLASALSDFVGSAGPGAMVDRLYVAFFLRLPDNQGYQYWIDALAGGESLTSIAEFFAESDEFQARYADKPFGEFLDQLYQDVLFRSPDEGGKAYWLNLLENDDRVTRGSIVSFFTEGPELGNLTSTRSEMVALTSLFEDRMPSQQEIQSWVSLRASQSLESAIKSEFINRR